MAKEPKRLLSLSKRESDRKRAQEFMVGSYNSVHTMDLLQFQGSNLIGGMVEPRKVAWKLPYAITIVLLFRIDFLDSSRIFLPQICQKWCYRLAGTSIDL